VPAICARRPGDEGVTTERAESLLSTFLGRRAASALMSDIRGGKLERIWASDVD
jgi:hypothetical protein